MAIAKKTTSAAARTATKTPVRKTVKTSAAKAKPAAAAPVKQVAAALAIKPDLAQEQVLEAATEQLGTVNEMMRQFAESGLAQSRTAFDRLRNAADAAGVSFEESTAATRIAGEKVVSAMIDSVSVNSSVAMEAAQALSTAGSLPAAFEIWAEFGRKQFETFTGKSESVSTAVAKYVESASKPLTTLYTKGMIVS